MTYTELFNVISQPWASVNDIMIIANCGRDTATKIRNSITHDISKQNKKIPTSKTIQVPMKYVIEYLNLDENYIIKMASIQSSINEGNNNYASISK